jgi:hypothetical protein
MRCGSVCFKSNITTTLPSGRRWLDIRRCDDRLAPGHIKSL